MSLKDIDLKKRLAAAIFATQEEKYEILEELKKATKEEMPEESAYFWELVDLMNQTISKPKETK